MERLFQIKLNLSPELRRVGMVFQEHALFPHLNVEKNIAVGLRKTNYEKKNRLIRVLLKGWGWARNIINTPTSYQEDRRKE